MPELPEAFFERLQQIFVPEVWGRVLKNFERPRPVAFRVNTLKTQPALVLPQLAAEGCSVRPVSWYASAFVLVQGTLRSLQATRAYRQGEIYVQELSSMLPVLALDPCPGEAVLDMAAAPGSKTTQIAAHMENTGILTANDASRARFFKLKANLEAQGVVNAVLTNKPGESFGRRRPESFERILLDVPCSGEGRFHFSEPLSFAGWKLSKLKALVPRQKMLFYSAFHALRPGGTLVYSTCTFAPEENEEILQWALEKFGSRMQIEKIDLGLTNACPGFRRWKKHEFDPEIQKAVRIVPDGEMEGFFVAKISKQGTVTKS